MAQPALQTFELPISELTNEMLGRLHQMGAEIYARHVRKPDVLVFSRLVLPEEPDGRAPGGLRVLEREAVAPGADA